MMNSNLLILPILLPLLCALLLVFTKNKNRVSKILYIGTMTVNTLISLALLIYVMNHKPITLDFGGWKAPFGIQFLGDTFKFTHGNSRFFCSDFNYGVWIWTC